MNSEYQTPPPHPDHHNNDQTQDANGKVTNSQLDTTNESQEVSPHSDVDQDT